MGREKPFRWAASARPDRAKVPPRLRSTRRRPSTRPRCLVRRPSPRRSRPGRFVRPTGALTCRAPRPPRSRSRREMLSVLFCCCPLPSVPSVSPKPAAAGRASAGLPTQEPLTGGLSLGRLAAPRRGCPGHFPRKSYLDDSLVALTNGREGRLGFLPPEQPRQRGGGAGLLGRGLPSAALACARRQGAGFSGGRLAAFGRRDSGLRLRSPARATGHRPVLRISRRISRFPARDLSWPRAPGSLPRKRCSVTAA